MNSLNARNLANFHQILVKLVSKLMAKKALSYL